MSRSLLKLMVHPTKPCIRSEYPFFLFFFLPITQKSLLNQNNNNNNNNITYFSFPPPHFCSQFHLHFPQSLSLSLSLSITFLFFFSKMEKKDMGALNREIESTIFPLWRNYTAEHCLLVWEGSSNKENKMKMFFFPIQINNFSFLSFLSFFSFFEGSIIY